MNHATMDPEARKQLLLTRIALERVQWSHDVQMLRSAANPRHIASNAVRSVFPPGWAAAIFGSPGKAGAASAASGIGNRVLQAVALARRYPFLASLAGGLLARRAVRRVIVMATFGTALAAGLWIANSSRKPSNPP